MTNPSPTSKEDILNETHWNFVVSKGISSVHTQTFPEAYKQQALIAMDSWSKQQAIAFAEWTQKNFYEQDDEGLWYKWANRSRESDQSYTTEELYNLFLQSQSFIKQ